MKDSLLINSALAKKDTEKIKKAFEVVYNDYFKIGIFIARQYLDDEDAIDVVEDVFVNFYSMLIKSNKCDIRNIKQYICTSVKNNAIRKLLENKKTITLNEEIHYKEQETNINIKPLLNGLNQEEQYIVVEHILFDKKLVEISKELKKPKNTIKSIYHRALLKLRKELSWTRKK